MTVSSTSTFAVNAVARAGRLLVALSVGLLIGSVGAGTASAESASEPRAGGVSGVLCKMGYRTTAENFIPADQSEDDNASAATISFVKTCVGPVVGTFSAIVDTTPTGFINGLKMRATCLGSGGQPSPCQTGTVFFAYPGESLLQSEQEFLQAITMTLVWPVLKRGSWRFDVLLGGDGTASVGSRTFVVQAFGP